VRFLRARSFFFNTLPTLLPKTTGVGHHRMSRPIAGSRLGASGSHLRYEPGLGVNSSNSALKQTAAGFFAEESLNVRPFLRRLTERYRRLSSPHWRTMRSQRSRTHTKPGRQRWWHIPQKISATRAAPFMRSSRCGIRAQPMASRFAQLVDALNRESRQILHRCLRNCVFPGARASCFD
jgi:hypothetical protein